MNGSLTWRSRSIKAEVTAKFDQFWRWRNEDREMEKWIQSERRE